MYLNQLLEEKGISKYKLAKLSGVPQSTIADICSGKTNIKKCSATEEADNFDYLKGIEEKHTNALNSENVSDILERRKRKSKGMSL